MKKWELSEDIRTDAELATRVGSIRPLVDEVLGTSAPLVAARWSVVPASDGRRSLAFNLSDWTCPGGVEARFGPDELALDFETRWKIHRLWGDLLQARNHRQLAELLKAEA